MRGSLTVRRAPRSFHAVGRGRDGDVLDEGVVLDQRPFLPGGHDRAVHPGGLQPDGGGLQFVPGGGHSLDPRLRHQVAVHPHQRGRGVEGHADLVATFLIGGDDRLDIAAPVNPDTGFRHHLVDRLRRPGIDHGGGCRRMDLHDRRRLAGPGGGDGAVDHIVIAALEHRIDLVVALCGVELCGIAGDGLAERDVGGMGMPEVELDPGHGRGSDTCDGERHKAGEARAQTEGGHGAGSSGWREGRDRPGRSGLDAAFVINSTHVL